MEKIVCIAAPPLNLIGPNPPHTHYQLHPPCHILTMVVSLQ